MGLPQVVRHVNSSHPDTLLDMRSYLLTFVLALVAGLLLGPVASRLGTALGAVDRTREPPVPRSGGLAIAAAAVVALVLLALVLLPARQLVLHSVGRLAPILLGAVAVLALGIWDDVRGLGALPKFSVEIALSVCLYLAGVRVGTLWLPLGIVELGQVLGLAVTVLWIVGITNAFNLLDGIDGAAAGAAVFALLAMFVTSVSLGQPMVALLTVALAGATAGFLPYNFPPARTFLGDTGSLFLGYMLATLAIEGATKGPAIVAIAIPIVAFGLPVLDTVIALLRRALRGAPLFQGDREHLHHRLLDLGLSPAQASGVLYAVSGAFALASMLFLNPNVRGMAVVLAMVGLVVFFAARYLRLHEFAELARLARRGMAAGKAISFNVEVRKAAAALEGVGTWDALVATLAQLFEAADFDAVRVVLEDPVSGAPRREYRLEGGGVVEGRSPPQADEWGVHLPFQVGAQGQALGELTVFRRYGRRALLTDVNLLVEVLRPALASAAGRVAPPAL